MMMPPYPQWSNAQLYSEVDRLLAEAIADEDREPELDAQFEAIYDAMANPGLRDYFGVVDAAIDAHIAMIDGMAARGAVLDVLLQEYETRFRAAPYRSFKQAEEMGQSDF